MTLTKCSVCGKNFNEDLEWLGMCIDCQMESDANAMQEMNQELNQEINN